MLIWYELFKVWLIWPFRGTVWSVEMTSRVAKPRWNPRWLISSLELVLRYIVTYCLTVTTSHAVDEKPQFLQFCFWIANINCELQPFGKQWWNESVSPSNLPVQGDLQEQRGRRHGCQQRHPLRTRRAPWPRRCDQGMSNETLAKLIIYMKLYCWISLYAGRVVCPVRGRQQEGHGWVHFGDIHGREKHHSVAQHLWGLSSGCSNHPGFSSPRWTQLSNSAQSRRRGLFPYTLCLPSLVLHL